MIRKLLPFFIIGIVFLIPHRTAYAGISSCAATISPSTVTKSSSNTYTVTVTNNDTELEAIWVKISRPSTNFSITGFGGISGWEFSISSADLILSGSTIQPNGEEFTVSFTAETGTTEASNSNWSVQLSDEPDGGTAVDCTGSLGTAISGSNTSGGPVISAITIAELSQSSVKINWTTDVSSNSTIDYGTSASYGSTKTSSDMVTSHSVTIDGLSAKTLYHFHIKSKNAGGTETTTDDNVVTTLAVGYSTVYSQSIVTPSPTPTPVPDRVGPRINIDTTFEKIYVEPPQIKGTVTDGSGVSSLEYSLDGGVNFVPVDDVKALGKPSVSFSYTPYQLDDGNYSLVMRSTDGKGNTSVLKSVTYTIDRMPPLFGASVVTFGSQVIEPVGNFIQLIAAHEYVFTSSIIGGPVTMKYSVENSQGELADVSAQKNIDTGLWRAIMRFDQAGTYTVFGVAIDGAANKTVTELMKVSVLPGGAVLDSHAKPIENAEVALFVLDTATQQFVEWDGKSYGQKNPFTTGKNGIYGFAIPAGKYYMRIRAFGYKSVISDIFEVDRISPIAQNIVMERAFGIQIGSWLIPLFDFSETRTVMRIAGHANLAGDTHAAGVIGKEMPYFRFPFDGKFITSLDLRGKPTLITMLNTWSPITAPQLSIIDTLTTLNSVHTIVIVPQESTASVATFMKRGSYDVRILADPDGTLVDPLMYRMSPTHMIVDRKGIVKSVITGLVTKEKIMDTIVE